MKQSNLRRFFGTAALGIVGSLASASAQAGGVQWSIGIEAPFFPGSVSTVISNAPRGYYAAPHEFLPPQPYVRGWPRPIYYVDVPPAVVYGPPPVYYRPVPRHTRDWDRRRHGHRQQWRHLRQHDHDD